MKKIITLIVTIIASLCMSVGIFAATTISDNLDLSKMKISWSDEFNGTSLNTDNWTYCIGNNGDNGDLWRWGNNELQYYKNSEENVKVSDGTLKLIARSESIGGCNYSSGRIKTDGKVEVGYGYVEARIKLPSVSGIWPAFWMLGANEPKGWPYCGEIDIMEAWNTGDFVQNCLHYADANGKDNYSNSMRTSSFLKSWGITSWNKTEWHTYGVLKTEDKLVFYYDGRRASRVIDITNELMTEMHNDYYILLNVACGGNLASNIAPSASNLPAQMEVDYVRYYVDKTPEEIAAEEAESKRKEEESSSLKAAEEASKAAEEASKAAAKAAPKKAVIRSIKNIKGRKISLKLKKIKDAKGYQIRYCDNKRFQGYINKNTKNIKVIIRGLDKRTRYWVKARAYKKVDGRKKYGTWSKVKKIKIKK